MKVSVLVPVYGVEHYIEQCAHSLMKQTHEDIEFVFVDDCSPDDSINVLKEVIVQYPERAGQVRIIHHEYNRGVGATRATALAAATGECVMHVDSDDYIDVHCVEFLVKRMEETGAMMVDGGYAIDHEGTITEVAPPFQGNRHTYVSTLLCQNIVFNRIWGRLINRQALLDSDLLSLEGIDYGDDFVLAPRMVAMLTREWVDKTLYYYRDDNSGSYTHTLSPHHHRSYLRACDVVIRHFEPLCEYQCALDQCKLAVLRHARRFGVDWNDVETICPEAFKPHAFCARFIARLLRSHLCPYGFGCAIYRIYRRLFLLSL